MNDLTLLKEAAREAGEIAKSHFKHGPQIWEKANNAGPVTQADLDVDHMLRNKLLAARPTYGWLSEETEDNNDRLSTDIVFIVDPIDGTRAFIEGTPHWAHSLAIVKNGRVQCAAVFLPMLDLMFTATLNSGALLMISLFQLAVGCVQLVQIFYHQKLTLVMNFGLVASLV